MIRLASATSSSALLFSKLEGLPGKGRFESGEKMDALQPLPTRLTSIWYPLYSNGCHVEGTLCRQDWAGNARALALFPKPPDSVGFPLKCCLRVRRASRAAGDLPPSDNPTYLSQRERFIDGIRKAGVPEG
jgi:hypothetical protein